MINRLILYTTIEPLGFLMRVFLLFIMYSFCGWVMEIICCIVEDGKIVNRGFFLGPYCPIHGVGCISCIFLLSYFKSKPIVVFILGTIIVSVLEYLTSYILEKKFHARWWDYTNQRFNINGRIKLLNCILFGLGIIFVIYHVNPHFVAIVNSIPYYLLKIIYGFIFTIFIIDMFVSFNIMNKIKNSFAVSFSNTIMDNTEEIRKIVSNFIKQNFKKNKS